MICILAKRCAPKIGRRRKCNRLKAVCDCPVQYLEFAMVTIPVAFKDGHHARIRLHDYMRCRVLQNAIRDARDHSDASAQLDDGVLRPDILKNRMAFKSFILLFQQ
jgi:hypothetical protein